MTFRGGTRERVQWDGQDRWRQLTFATPAPAVDDQGPLTGEQTDVSEAELLDKKAAAPAMTREQCTPYSKDGVFAIGEHIYHSDLDDIGRVVRKDKTSNGTHSILVAFERSGERRLLENVTAEMMEEVPEEPQPPGQE